MNIKYYGTAAAEGWPGLFCLCDSCMKARRLGGKNIRTRSQSLITSGDSKLLIDFPADTYLHVLNYGLDLTKIAHCIITHNHSDHYYPFDFWCRNRGIAAVIDESVPMMTIYGGKSAGDFYQQVEFDSERTQFKVINKYEPIQIDKFTVTALDADHQQTTDCVLYIISDGEKTFLYAHDTGYFPEKTWDYLISNKIYFDAVSLDCTSIMKNNERNHMGLNANRKVRDRLYENKLADENTRFIINHFSHNGGPIYDELVDLVGEEFTVSYDGLEVEF